MSAGFEPGRPAAAPGGLTVLASVILLVSAVVIAALVAVGVVASTARLDSARAANSAAHDEADAKAASIARAEAAAKNAAEEKAVTDAAAAAEQKVDEFWQAKNYYKESPGLYWKYAKDGSFECDDYPCIGVRVVSVPGCDKGFTLKASLIENGKETEAVTKKMPGLKALESGIALINDRSMTADYIQLDGIFCRD